MELDFNYLICVKKLYLYSNADADANADTEMPMPRFPNGQLLVVVFVKALKVLKIFMNKIKNEKVPNGYQKVSFDVNLFLQKFR